MGIRLERAGARFLDVRVRAYESLRRNAHWLEFANDNLAALPVVAAKIALTKAPPLMLGTCWAPAVRDFIRERVMASLRSQYEIRIDRDGLVTNAAGVAGRAATLLNSEITDGTLRRVVDSEIEATLRQFRTQAQTAARKRAQLEAAKRTAEQKVRLAQTKVEDYGSWINTTIAEETQRAEEAVRRATEARLTAEAAQRNSAEQARRAQAAADEYDIAIEELRRVQEELRMAIAEEAANNDAVREAEARAVEIKRTIKISTTAALDHAHKKIVSQAETATKQRLEQGIKDALQTVEKQIPVEEFVDRATEELTGLIDRFILKIAEIVEGDSSFQTAGVDTHELGEILVEILLKAIKDNNGKTDPGGMQMIALDRLISRGLFLVEDRLALQKLLLGLNVFGSLDEWWNKYQSAIQTLSPENSGSVQTPVAEKAKAEGNES
ncbi:hypothetical protein HZC35_01315 [Candidatus Saganbacteria bacterium]|nr:hypothetical protein [Candidatus Saganbacteria bacterium]